MAFEGGVAGEGAVALTADVAAHARMDLHVLLECTLCLETLPTQQTEDSHVCASMGLPVCLQGVLLRKLGPALITDKGFGTR